LFYHIKLLRTFCRYIAKGYPFLYHRKEFLLETFAIAAGGRKKKSLERRNGMAQTNRTGSNRTPGTSPVRRKTGIFAKLICLAAVIACGFFLFELARIDILPGMMFLFAAAVLSLVLLITVFFWLSKSRRKFSRILCAVLVLAIGAGSALGSWYLMETDTLFSTVSSLSDEVANTITVYAMNETGITSPSQISGMTAGILGGEYLEQEEKAMAQLESKGASFDYLTYSTPYALVDALYEGAVDFILFPEEEHDAINAVADDDNAYNALTTFTNTVDRYIYYTQRSKTDINPADSVTNIMTDPFTILISGSDTYGAIGTAARSDVNMLVTVNPKTKQIAMISLPRDTYTEITCKKNTGACSAVYGEEDKLTHAGIYGIGTSESTIEDLLDIEINYTVQVNFSSLINVVDAIGGIDVTVEEGLEVETFYSNGLPGVTAGVNHLDGERALAFARERYAYIDGDNQRVRNQQIVLKALMQAMMSPSMVVNYPAVIEALSTAFATNMSAQEMKSLLTLELMGFPEWNIVSYSLTNTSSTEYSPTVGDYTSVSIAYTTQIEKAKTLIDDVLEGKTISEVEQAASSGSIPVSQEQTDDPYDNGDYRPDFYQEYSREYEDYQASDDYEYVENPYSGHGRNAPDWQDEQEEEDSRGYYPGYGG
jgi:LCP family protein required for cell wall assembly